MTEFERARSEPARQESVRSGASDLLDADRWERLVDATPGIDPWCSGPDWVVPAFAAYAPPGTYARVEDHGELGAALLASYASPDGRVLAGLEPLWGFACPLIGPHPDRLLESVLRRALADGGWRRLVVPGFVDAEELRRLALSVLDVVDRLNDRSPGLDLEVGLAEGIGRRVADLEGGIDAWWERRSQRFRRNLRRARRRADEAGVTFEDLQADPDGTLLDRLVAIEDRGWKGAEQSGISAPEMAQFYRDMALRLDARGRLRASIAMGPDGEDLAFILGGTRGPVYRGLQLSFVSSAAELSLGHLLQWREIAALAELGIETYDLGMDMDYKTSWSDRLIPSHVLVVQRGD